MLSLTLRRSQSSFGDLKHQPIIPRPSQSLSKRSAQALREKAIDDAYAANYYAELDQLEKQQLPTTAVPLQPSQKEGVQVMQIGIPLDQIHVNSIHQFTDKATQQKQWFRVIGRKQNTDLFTIEEVPTPKPSLDLARQP